MIAYCVDAAKSLRLMDEIVADAGYGLIAIDTETAPAKAEVDRVSELRAEDAVISGKLRAANKANASVEAVAALKAEATRLKAQIAYRTAGRPRSSPVASPASADLRRWSACSGHRPGPVGEGVLQRLGGKRLVRA
jgi:hypothetical protein